nr:MAG TPA: hypothetical protein [Caudoviricetes sp.]
MRCNVASLGVPPFFQRVTVGLDIPISSAAADGDIPCLLQRRR